MLFINSSDFIFKEPSIVALGNFDGIHLGHKKLLSKLNNKEKKSIVFSFYPYPNMLFKKNSNLILSREEKREFLEDLGIDTYIEYPFDIEFSKILPYDFIKNILVDKLNVKEIIVGFNNRFGRDRSGDINTLKYYSDVFNYKVNVIEPVYYNDDIVSSSRIRNELAKDNIELVNNLLGHLYFMKGNVKYGKQLGAKLGVPTANVIPDRDKLLPSNGVYISKVKYKYKIYEAITNIGYNPSVNGDTIITETNIFEFDEDIYGEDIYVYILKKIRDEKKFSSIEELKYNMDKDIEMAKKYFI